MLKTQVLEGQQQLSILDPSIPPHPCLPQYPLFTKWIFRLSECWSSASCLSCTRAPKLTLRLGWAVTLIQAAFRRPGHGGRRQLLAPGWALLFIESLFISACLPFPLPVFLCLDCSFAFLLRVLHLNPLYLDNFPPIHLGPGKTSLERVPPVSM